MSATRITGGNIDPARFADLLRTSEINQQQDSPT